MRVSVIVAAAGAGRRVGARRPKAFLLLAGKPLFLYSIETFASLPFVREIVLVAPSLWIRRILREWGRALLRCRVAKIVAGGERRQDSVWNGLRITDTQCDVVLVHDAARPFVSREVIRRTADAARRHGAALPVVPSVDTVKIVDGRGRVRETPERDSVRAAQTPQGFLRRTLVRAYQAAGDRDATDDAQLVERAGGRVIAVPGDPGNFKVTTPEDLRRAEEIVRRGRPRLSR